MKTFIVVTEDGSEYGVTTNSITWAHNLFPALYPGSQLRIVAVYEKGAGAWTPNPEVAA